MFGNEVELIIKIADHLERPDVRENMIGRAYARCIPAYGCDAGAASIAELIEDRLGAKWPRAS